MSDDEKGELGTVTLENRHRKEKKELQAQIQAMKKAAKNDKTKKKDLVVEIARLEMELDIRHKKELEAYQTVTETQEDDPEDAETVAVKKKSKAQRRRDKKSQQERDIDEKIKLQAKENLHGPRNTENKAITSKLKSKNLMIFSIPADGDCLYKAVAHQYQVTRDKTFSVKDLRKKVSNFIKDNKDDFLPFMSDPNTREMLTDELFEEYCDKIANTNVWGGQLEIRALSQLLKCPIQVIQATGPDSIDLGSEFEAPPLIISYHRHMYRLGEHYNSTQTLEEDKEN